MLTGVPDNLTFCINNEINMPIFIEELKSLNCTINDCSDDWNTKTKKSIDDKHICVYDCSMDDTYIYHYKNKCYDICPEGTTLSSDNKNCLISCPVDLPFQKKEECFADCSAEEFYNKICIINNKNILSKEKMVDIIENNIIDGLLTLLLEDVLNNNENDLIEKDISEIYQITTSKNQNNKEYNNGETIINLGQCENLLKERFGLSNDETLIIFKVDYFLNDFLIPITEYEIFNPRTKDKINLNM